MFDGQLQGYWEPPETPRSQSLIEQLAAAGRAENQAAARRLTAVADLFEMRRAERGEEPDWAVDTWAAVAAEVAAYDGPLAGERAGRAVLAAHAQIQVDYLVITDPQLGPAVPGTGRVLVAARLGETRLIDNLPCSIGPAS